jgi:hypothetical protein
MTPYRFSVRPALPLALALAFASASTACRSTDRTRVLNEAAEAPPSAEIVPVSEDDLMRTRSHELVGCVCVLDGDAYRLRAFARPTRARLTWIVADLGAETAAATDDAIERCIASKRQFAALCPHAED